MRRLALVVEALDILQDAINIGEHSDLERVVVRRRDILSGQTQDAAIEIVEGAALSDRSCDLTEETTRLVSIIDEEYTTRLADGLDDRLAIQRSQRHEVNHFDLDTLLSSLVSSLEDALQHTAIGNHSDILTDTLDISLANRQDKVRRGGHLALHIVLGLVLKEDHRVVVTDSSLQQTLDICRGTWSYDLETRDVAEP